MASGRYAQPSNGRPFTFTVAGNQHHIFRILVGEVWVAAGINMEFGLKGHSRAKKHLPGCQSNIRLLYFPHVRSMPKDDIRYWKSVTRRRRNFSAVGYFFGDLQKARNVPSA